MYCRAGVLLYPKKSRSSFSGTPNLPPFPFIWKKHNSIKLMTNHIYRRGGRPRPPVNTTHTCTQPHKTNDKSHTPSPIKWIDVTWFGLSVLSPITVTWRDVEDAVPYKVNRCYVIRFMYYRPLNYNLSAGVKPPPYDVIWNVLRVWKIFGVVKGDFFKNSP